MQVKNVVDVCSILIGANMKTAPQKRGELQQVAKLLRHFH